jgi:ribosomal protein S18 acetylase RimI-like enzyme
MPGPIRERPLDNPVWSSLTTRHAHLAQGAPPAVRYPPAFSSLCGVAAADPAHLADVLALAEVGDDIAVTVVEVPALPPNWEVLQRLRLVQMIRQDRTPLPEGGPEISPLTTVDIDAMLALVELTHPGPFRRRTNELGTFVGVRVGGRLLAMAGERMWIGDFREVSGVCTDPEAQGRGFARALMARVVNRMLRAGQTPFLHAASTNERAIATYEGLGFVRRTEFALLSARRIG